MNGARRTSRVQDALRAIAALLLATVAASGAEEAARASEAEVAQRALRALDQAIARYEMLVGKIDDPEVGATARAFLANYRERRDALRRSYDATKHDELRFDINVESHRLAQWLTPPRTPRKDRSSDKVGTGPAGRTSPGSASH
jgi:hypothetical protein